jgi:polyphosphate kinase
MAQVQESAEPGTVALMTEAARVVETASPAEALPLFDRELSWLEFNRRVLGEAESDDVPLLDRIKFLAICANNLDEFFMIRVGALRDVIEANLADLSVVAESREQLDAVRRRARRLLEHIYRCLGDELLPALRKENIRIETVTDLGKKERAQIEDYFTREIEPILTPLAVDPSHPFPFIANLTLNVAMLLDSGRGEGHFAILKIPESLPRLIPVDKSRYVLIEDIVSSHIGRLFPGLRLRRSAPFRVVRNSDISITEDDVQDLLKSVEMELRRRERQEVVSLEISSSADEALVQLLTKSLSCTPTEVFLAPGPLKIADLRQLYDDVDAPALKDKPFNPRIPAQLATAEDIFAIIRRGDIMLHRPYESIATVIELVQSATEDPYVVAIKQTLYRTDVGSPIVEALARAAAAGKQVTAVVELQARFDEKKNISWSRHLEQAGVQVVYGLFGMKTHCKTCLVVRREGSELRRYVHLSTGNYNAVTARVYNDIDFFTCDPDFGADAAQLMNLLTGFSTAGVQELIDHEQLPIKWRNFIVAPMDYLAWVLEMIERETRNAKEGKPARIVAKMNALVDKTVIAALYRASRAGVRVQLLVRGICCLVPGLPDLSENIEVISIVDRFLEHSRVFRFENGGAPQHFLSSGDWMPRNFFRRVEVTWPVRSEAVIKRIEEQLLPISLADNVKSWILRSDGKYERRKTDGTPVRSQEAFIAIARAEAVKLGPYDEMVRRPGSFRRKAKKKKHK